MRVVGLVLVLLCAACAEAAPGAVRAAGGHVSGTEGRALLAAGATLLDVRSPAEFAAGHLDGAVHVPVDELDATAMAWASRLASGPTRTLALTKQLVNRALDVDRAAAFEAEANAQDINMLATHDGPEGVASFVARRPSEFTGW